jgi:hypothetical protein
MKYLARRPADHIGYFSAMLGRPPTRHETDELAWSTPRGELVEIIGPRRIEASLPGARVLPPAAEGWGVGIIVEVSSMERLRHVLRKAGVPAVEKEARLVIANYLASGVAIEFVEEKA